jgi:hypothetical protein
VQRLHTVWTDRRTVTILYMDGQTDCVTIIYMDGQTDSVTLYIWADRRTVSPLYIWTDRQTMSPLYIWTDTRCHHYIWTDSVTIAYMDGQTDSVTTICSLCVECIRSHSTTAVCRQLTPHNAARGNITAKLHGLAETSIHVAVAETSPCENLRKGNTSSESLRRADW